MSFGLLGVLFELERVFCWLGVLCRGLGGVNVILESVCCGLEVSFMEGILECKGDLTPSLSLRVPEISESLTFSIRYHFFNFVFSSLNLTPPFTAELFRMLSLPFTSADCRPSGFKIEGFVFKQPTLTLDERSSITRFSFSIKSPGENSSLGDLFTEENPALNPLQGLKLKVED